MTITDKPESKTVTKTAIKTVTKTVTTASASTTALETNYVPPPSGGGPPRTMDECVRRFKHLCAWVATRLEAQRVAGCLPEHDPTKPWMRPRPSLRRKARYMQQQLILQKFFREQRILQ